MRQLYPVIWLATLGLAAIVLLRPGGVGTLLALAANWENVPWSDTYTPPTQRSVTMPEGPSGPLGPGTGSRPAAWPGGAASGVSNPLRQDRQQWVTPHADRYSEPSPSSEDATRRQYAPAPPYAADPGPDAPARGVSPVSQRPAEEYVQATDLPAEGDRGAERWDGQADRRYPEDRPGDRAGNQGPPQNGPLVWSRPAADPFAEPAVSGPPGMPASAAVEPGLDAGVPVGPQPGADVPPPANAVLCEGAEALARVGSEVILTKELSWGIAELRSKNKQVPQEVLEAKIREVLKQRLDQKIEEKLVYLDAKRSIPAENFPKVKDNVAREFENSQVPRLMKATNARTRQELEDSLQAAGSSLEVQKRSFVDQVLAHEWLRQQTKVDEVVTREQTLTYYREHAAEFETPARARWEQLMVRASRFPSRADAHAALAEMGNQVLAGAPLAEVAKAQSHGSTAPQGGSWDWTSQGSLASPLLNRVIFGDGERPGIPVGSLSPILEDEQAFHIIRVVAREPVQRTPFPEAQVEIKKKIRAEREVKAKQDYLAKLRRDTRVWTAFDATAQAQRPTPNRFVQ